MMSQRFADGLAGQICRRVAEDVEGRVEFELTSSVASHRPSPWLSLLGSFAYFAAEMVPETRTLRPDALLFPTPALRPRVDLCA